MSGPEARVGPLAGRLVLDCGAGTGIASRQLAARGARVVSLDLGEQWWDAYQSALAASCPSYFLQHLSQDWSHSSITRSSASGSPTARWSCPTSPRCGWPASPASQSSLLNG